MMVMKMRMMGPLIRAREKSRSPSDTELIPSGCLLHSNLLLSIFSRGS